LLESITEDFKKCAIRLCDIRNNPCAAFSAAMV